MHCIYHMNANIIFMKPSTTSRGFLRHEHPPTRATSPSAPLAPLAPAPLRTLRGTDGTKALHRPEETHHHDVLRVAGAPTGGKRHLGRIEAGRSRSGKIGLEVRGVALLRVDLLGSAIMDAVATACGEALDANADFLASVWGCPPPNYGTLSICSTRGRPPLTHLWAAMFPLHSTSLFPLYLTLSTGTPAAPTPEDHSRILCDPPSHPRDRLRSDTMIHTSTKPTITSSRAKRCLVGGDLHGKRCLVGWVAGSSGLAQERRERAPSQTPKEGRALRERCSGSRICHQMT